MMARKILVFPLTILMLAGCASAASKNTGPSVDTICLTSCDDIPIAIEQFKKTHPLKTEKDEMDYLFYRIRSSPPKFIRNGMEVKGGAAAQFLRWKLGWYKSRYHESILTDEDFVAKILKGSEKTGRPYEIVMPDGRRYNAQWVMKNELNYLNSYHKDASMGG